MNRRDLLKLSPLLIPLSVVSFVTMEADHVKHQKMVNGKIRVSCIKGDPGERNYSAICGDDKKVIIRLNGEVVDDVVTADEKEGLIVKIAMTENKRVMFNRATGEIIYDTLRGDVRIEIVSA